MKRLDVQGKRFGRLVVLEPVAGSAPLRWKCICDCGRAVERLASNLGRHTNSCGCLRKEVSSKRARESIVHGLTGTPEWVVWDRMIQRCYCPKNHGYRLYGARGVAVCERWRGTDGFLNFLSDVGKRPTVKHQLGRKNDTGNYEPGNCWWMTPVEQGENRKDQVWLEHGGERLRVKEWAARLGLHRRSLLSRLEAGWSVDKALTTPVIAKFRRQ